MTMTTRYKHADTEWMDSSFGLGIHWTSKSTAAQGNGLTVDHQSAVKNFNVRNFTEQLRRANAKHCIFTLTHEEHFLPMPHALLDAIYPGHTTERDLAGELAESLHDAGIRVIFYYNHSCNGMKNQWKEAVGYSEGNLDLFAARICMMVEMISRRYGDLVDGWWFDSCYSVDDRGIHHCVTSELGDWRFPWEALSEAAKIGNPGAAVTFNSGVDCLYMYTHHQDYYAGEITELNVSVDGPFYKFDGLHAHRWIPADTMAWVHCQPDSPFAAPRFETAEFKNFIEKHLARKAMVTLNVEIDQTGQLNPATLKQIQAMKLTTYR